MPAEQLPILWQVKISNFSEKARWALDYKRVPHHRRDLPPGAHMLVTLARTRRVVTVPVLKLNGRTFGDSSQIVATLEQHTPDPPLYPADPAQRRRALELEEFFGENLGHEVRRVAFSHLLRHPEVIRARAVEMTTPRQGPVLAASLPVFAFGMRRRYSISDATAAQSLLKIRAAMRLIEDRLDGGDYLAGDTFSIADLTAAALLAPLLSPPELPHGMPLSAFPPPLAQVATELRELPAGRWLLRMYAQHRSASMQA